MEREKKTRSKSKGSTKRTLLLESKKKTKQAKTPERPQKRQRKRIRAPTSKKRKLLSFVKKSNFLNV